MEIKEIISYFLNSSTNVLDVSFRTIEDSEEVLRTDNIDYTHVEDYGFDLVSESFDFFDDDFADDEILEGEDKIDGTACWKLKLEKKTMLVEGEEIPNIEYYYIDKDSNVPIMMESEINSGDMKGKIGQTKFSDYQEVSSLIYPFSISQGIKDGPSQPITFEKVVINPTVEAKTFMFPEN